jgi:hypothetical protein
MTNELNLTDKELIFLKAMTKSDFYDRGINSVLWDFSVNEELPYSGKIRSGVVSSLTQKEILVVQKKEKGDTAGMYYLTDVAKQNPEIISIFK